MNTHLIKQILAVTLVMVSASSILASQLGNGDSGEAGTALAEDPTFVPEDSVLPESSKALPFLAEFRDSAFVWNIAFGAYRHQGDELGKLQLSETQASNFESLCRDYSNWLMELKQQRAPDDGISDAEESRRKMHVEVHALMARFRENFMAILTDAQRDYVFRQTLRNGGAFAMLHLELRKRFHLTEEQVKRISEIRDANFETLNSYFATPTYAAYRTKAEPFIAAAREQLTVDQKIQFEQFTAKQFHSPVTVLPDIETRIADLRKELQSLEADGTRRSDQNDEARDTREQALRRFVAQAFDVRQQLQRLEAHRMQLQLQTIERNIDAREKNRDSIIQHRVDEMLDSDGMLTGRNAGDKTTSTTNPGMPVTGTPIGLSGPVVVPDGGSVGVGSQQAPNSNAKIQWPQPAEIVKDLQEHRNQVTTCLTILKKSQQKIELWSKPLEELKAAGIADPKMSETLWLAEIASAKSSAESDRETLNRALREWNQAWAYYHTQLRLLQFDVEEAQLAVEPLQQKRDRMKRLDEAGYAPFSEVTQAASDISIAKIKVQRAEEMLKLYADIEAQEPRLNPDSRKSEK